MTCSIPGHHHDEKDDTLGLVYRCNLCRTEFEEGVADPEKATDLPRCPQCFMSDVRRIRRSEYHDFIIRKSTRFR